MKKKVKVEAKKTIYTYSYLYIAAMEALHQAEASEEGRFYTCMTAELFSAFCLEAYLNHIGSQKIPYWDSVERKLGSNEKLEIISYELKIKIDFSKRPFQSFRRIFQLRNSLAHGKTEFLESNQEEILDVQEKPKLPEAKWKSLINLKMAKEFTYDTKMMIDLIHEKSGIERNTLLNLESSEWLIHIDSNNIN